MKPHEQNLFMPVWNYKVTPTFFRWWIGGKFSSYVPIVVVMEIWCAEWWVARLGCRVWHCWYKHSDELLFRLEQYILKNTVSFQKNVMQATLLRCTSLSVTCFRNQMRGACSFSCLWNRISGNSCQQHSLRCKEALINFQVCSSRDAVQKEGVVISFTSSEILEMRLLMRIMIVGIRGGSDSIVLSYGPDQGQGQARAVPVGEGHSGQWLLADRSWWHCCVTSICGDQ